VRRRSTWVAWSMLAVFVAGYAGTTLLAVANGNLQPDSAPLLLAFAAFMTVGSVIVAHRPGNAVGWIFSAVGLLSAAGWLAMEYAAYAYLTRPGALPGAALAAWCLYRAPSKPFSRSAVTGRSVAWTISAACPIAPRG
jgi:hypothetical protein